jgi:hypothetical protein
MAEYMYRSPFERRREARESRTRRFDASAKRDEDNALRAVFNNEIRMIRSVAADKQARVNQKYSDDLEMARQAFHDYKKQIDEVKRERTRVINEEKNAAIRAKEREYKMRAVGRPANDEPAVDIREVDDEEEEEPFVPIRPAAVVNALVPVVNTAPVVAPPVPVVVPPPAAAAPPTPRPASPTPTVAYPEEGESKEAKAAITPPLVDPNVVQFQSFMDDMKRQSGDFTQMASLVAQQVMAIMSANKRKPGRPPKVNGEPPVKRSASDVAMMARSTVAASSSSSSSTEVMPTLRSLSGPTTAVAPVATPLSPSAELAHFNGLQSTDYVDFD